MVVHQEGEEALVFKYSVDLDATRIKRYAISAYLWHNKHKKFQSRAVDVLLDTGAFNTIVHKPLVSQGYGVFLKQKMTIAIGGYKGDADLCVLHKLKVGGLVMEQVMALALPLDGELKEHIILGANVTNHWRFEVSRRDNRLYFTEEFSKMPLAGNFPLPFPYRYCFNREGIMAFQTDLEHGVDESNW